MKRETIACSWLYNGHPSAFERARELADSMLGDDRFRVRVDVVAVATKRSISQNARFHWLCGLISKRMEWAGRRLGAEDWKRLLVDAWTRETHRMAAVFVPSLDGSGVVPLGAQTRRMSVADMHDLIEFVQAWATDQGIEIPAPKGTTEESNTHGTHPR